ncbi:hypothetical protein KIPB_009721, partial [Kipferlia bialata]
QFWWNDTENGQTYKHIAIVVVAVLVLFPLSIMTKLDFLRHTSLAALCSVAYIVCVIIIVFILISTGTFEGGSGPVRAINNNPMEIFVAFPLFGVAFTAHYNCLNVYKELKNRKVSTMNKVIKGSGVIIIAVYVCMGLFGYLSFRDDVNSDVLLNLASLVSGGAGGWWVNLANIAMLLTILCSYPLVCFALRNSISGIVWGRRNMVPTRQQQILVVVCIITFAVFIAIVVGDIGAVLSFSGSIAGTNVVYILPGLFFYKLLPKEDNRRKLAIFIIATGAFFFVTGLWSAVYTVILHPSA